VSTVRSESRVGLRRSQNNEDEDEANSPSPLPPAAATAAAAATGSPRRLGRPRYRSSKVLISSKCKKNKTYFVNVSVTKVTLCFVKLVFVRVYI